MDLDALGLMVQGLAGRVIAVEGEAANLWAQLAAVIAEPESRPRTPIYGIGHPLSE